MALHRNIGFITDDYGMPPSDELMIETNGGGGGGSDAIVIDYYYPKDPILPADIDDSSNGELIKPTEDATTVQTTTTPAQLYVSGYLYDKKTGQLMPGGVTIQMFDAVSGASITQPYILPDGSYSAWADADPTKLLVKFSKKGYQSKGILFSKLIETPDVYLTTASDSQMLWLAAGAGMIFFAAKKRKSKRVGKVDVYKYYEGLPPIAKGILTVGGAYILYTTLDKIFTKPPPDDKEPNQAGEYLEQLAQQGIFPSYSSAQYESFSNSIVQAIWDCGTDEDAIYNVMASMNNEADIYRLVQVYGVREYKGCFENFFDFVSRSLSGAISSELDASEKRHVNDILASKGITFRFA